MDESTPETDETPSPPPPPETHEKPSLPPSPETDKKSSLPPSPAPLLQGLTIRLMFAISAAGVGSGFQHGFNTGVVNQPQQLVENFINQTLFNRSRQYPTTQQVTLIFSALVSIYCIGGMLGGLLTAFIAERMGSRGGLIMNNIFIFVGAILLGFAKLAASFEMLFIGRFIVGVNSGLNAGLSPMYLTEISPIVLRGAVGTIYQLVITISILSSQFLGLPVILGTEKGWPILFGLIFIPGLVMITTLPMCPESPKHIFIKKGKEDDAKIALTWFRGTNEVDDEMEAMKREYEQMEAVPKVTLADMWKNHSLRRPLIISIVMMLSQQFSGINAVIFFSTAIFLKAGLKQNDAVYATLGIGIINVLMTLVSMVLVEKAGRRTLHLVGLGGMAVMTVLLTLCIAFTYRANWLSYISILCVIAFIIFFASGPGSIPWFLVAELFDQGPRPIATSIAVAVNWLANFIVGLSFLPLSEVINEYTFLIFTFLLILFFIFTIIEVPETKGRPIEEITAQFK